MAVVVAIYTRVSREDAEVPQSTRRQERACRDYARSRSWEVAEVFEDVDVSAYVRGVRRPAFEALLRALSCGQVDGVLVWKTDRLVRRASDFERFWERCEHASVFLASATEPIDSTTAMGLAVIRILVNFANVEATSTSLRVSSRLREKARNGTALGPRRPFGFDQSSTKIIESEAALIREAASRCLAGESLSSIALDWNGRAITTPQGKANWEPGRIGQMLRNCRLIGHNSFRGEVVALDCFPAILDPLTFARLQSALTVSRTRPSTKKRLLTGLLRCHFCGSTLEATRLVPRQHDGPRRPIYRCNNAHVCGRVSIDASFIETIVTEAVLYRIGAHHRRRPTSDAPADASARLAAEFSRHSAALTQLADDYYVHRRLTRQEWETARDGLEHQLLVARRQLDTNWARSPVRRRRGSPSSLRSHWESFDTSHRRDIISSELKRVIVRRIGYEPIDLGTVEPLWWDDVGSSAEPGWPAAALMAAQPWTQPDLVSSNQAAALLGISRSQVVKRATRGLLAFERPGKNYRFRRDDIETFRVEYADALNIGYVAEQFGVTESCICLWIRRGLLPAHRVGRSQVVRAADLARWSIELSHLIKPIDAAERFGISPSWIYELIKTGRLGSVTRGNGTLHVDRRAIETLVKVRRRTVRNGALRDPGRPRATRTSATERSRTMARA